LQRRESSSATSNTFGHKVSPTIRKPREAEHDFVDLFALHRFHGKVPEPAHRCACHWSIVLRVWPAVNNTAATHSPPTRRADEHATAPAGRVLAAITPTRSARRRGHAAWWPENSGSRPRRCRRVYHLLPKQRVAWLEAWNGAENLPIRLIRTDFGFSVWRCCVLRSAIACASATYRIDSF
jgi:hypothetical protein